MTAYAQTNIALYEELRRAGRAADLAPVAEAYVLAARLFAHPLGATRHNQPEETWHEAGSRVCSH